ncbi:MAG: hypothetical protein Q9159_000665 [Coniocarpon cinnabarinum]
MSASASAFSLDSASTAFGSTLSSTLVPKRGEDSASSFKYTTHYSFPPFFDLQPNLATRASQLKEWSELILSYCAFHRIYRFTPSHPLFHNAAINRRMQLGNAKVVLQYVVDQGRAEWIASLNKRDKDSNMEEAWIWWKSPEEWAQCIGDWVQETGQRNTVLTFYELLEGEATSREEFHNLPVEMARRSIGILVKRGKANIFGEGEGLGVKFFF